MRKRKISVKYFLDKRSIKRTKTRSIKNVKLPLRVRIIYNRKPHEISTLYSFTEEEYNLVNNLSNRGKYKKIRKDLEKMLDEIERITLDMPMFDIKMLKAELFNETINPLNIYDVFELRCNDFKKIDSYKNAGLYTTVKNSLKKFTKNDNLQFSDIDVEFLNKYEKWLLKNGCTETTTGGYTKYIRAIFNYADAEDYYPKSNKTYPFGKSKYIVRQSSFRHMALSDKELNSITKYKTEPYSSIDKSKDLWLFSMYCGGINFIDMSMLTDDSLINGELVFRRRKTIKYFERTGESIKVPLTENAKNILKKWKPKNSKFLFPIMDRIDKKLPLKVYEERYTAILRQHNKRTKKIGVRLALSYSLTTYVARHTFISKMYRNDKTAEFISDFTGHSDIKVLRHYITGFNSDKKLAALDCVFGN